MRRVVKTTKNVWVAADKPYVYEGRSNVHALALALDGQLNIDKVLRDLPQNKPGGRPRKNLPALSKQPLDIQHVPPAGPLPANSTRAPECVRTLARIKPKSQGLRLGTVRAASHSLCSTSPWNPLPTTMRTAATAYAP